MCQIKEIKMKNLMNKLGMVAIVVALGIAGYVVVNNCMKNVDSVKIQGKAQSSPGSWGSNERGNNDECTNSDCATSFLHSA